MNYKRGGYIICAFILGTVFGYNYSGVFKKNYKEKKPVESSSLEVIPVNLSEDLANNFSIMHLKTAEIIDDKNSFFLGKAFEDFNRLKLLSEKKLLQKAHSFCSSCILEHMHKDEICAKENNKKDSLLKNLHLIGLKTVEPHMYIKKGPEDKPQIALTFDLCMGKTDYRILDMLISHKIKATFFITKRWMDHNKRALALIKKHVELFEAENHGARHIPAIDNIPCIYGIKTAGSLQNIYNEVHGGVQALIKEGFAAPQWYRTATARYSPDAIALIKKMGYKIAGFSINGDVGATLSSERAKKQIESAKNGDVVIAHMNHPEKAAGEGIQEGILVLKQRGYTFIKLSEGA